MRDLKHAIPIGLQIYQEFGWSILGLNGTHLHHFGSGPKNIKHLQCWNPKWLLECHPKPRSRPKPIPSNWVSAHSCDYLQGPRRPFQEGLGPDPNWVTNRKRPCSHWARAPHVFPVSDRITILRCQSPRNNRWPVIGQTTTINGNKIRCKNMNEVCLISNKSLNANLAQALNCSTFCVIVSSLVFSLFHYIQRTENDFVCSLNCSLESA